MSILSPYIAKFQSLVKKLSDGALSQALQMHSDPSDPKGFWLAQEAMGRAAARKDAQTGNANQPTVAQQLAQQLTPQPQGMPPGMGAMPPQGMPPGMGAMPPQGMPPEMGAMPPQGMPVAMAQAGGHVHDYGIAGLPYEPRYEHGGIVSFAEGGDEELDKGLYEGQSFEGYDPDDPSQMLAELDTKGRSKEAQQQLEADTDAANVLTALRSIATGPALGLAGAADVGTMIPRGFGALAWERGEDGKLTRKMDNPDFNWFPATEAVKNWADAPIGDDFVSTRYDPNSDNAPLPKEKYKPTTSNMFSALNPEAGNAPEKPFEAAPTPRRASVNDLYNPAALNQPPIPAEEPPAPMPSNIREVTPTGLASGADRFLMGSAGLPAAASAASGAPGQNYAISETAKPAERTPEDDIKDAQQLERLNKLYGYNPDLNQKFIEENAAALAGLSKKKGKAALSDLAAAMVAFGQGTAKQGLMSFGQTLNERFRQSDKEIDAEEAAYKKRDVELRSGLNDLKKNNVEKGMAKIEKANADFTAWKANREKDETERNKTVFEIEQEARQKAADREARLREAYAEIASNEYRTRYTADATAGDKTDPLLAAIIDITKSTGVSPNTLMEQSERINANIDDPVVEAEVERRTNKKYDWKNVKPDSEAARLKIDIRKEMVSSILSRRAAEATQLSADPKIKGVLSLLSGQPPNGTRDSNFYSVIPR